MDRAKTLILKDKYLCHPKSTFFNQKHNRPDFFKEIDIPCVRITYINTKMHKIHYKFFVCAKYYILAYV